MLTTVFLLIGLLLIICFIIKEVKYHDNEIGESNPFNDQWMSQKGRALKTIQKVTKIFNNAGVDYIIGYGTLLGYQRNSGLIPWDDDIDLIIVEQPEKIRQLLNVPGLSLVNHSLGFDKVFLTGTPLISGYNWGWPFIDLFYAEKKNDQVLVYNKYGTVPISRYPIDSFYPLQSVMFYNLLIKVPSRPVDILTVDYGSKFHKVCLSSNFNHRLEQKIPQTYTTHCQNLTISEQQKFPTYVINLKRRPDRRLNVISQLQKINIKPKFISAVDAKLNVVKQFYQQLSNNAISIEELACALSHIKIWKKIVKQKIPLTLVLEDDIIIPPNINYQSLLHRLQDSKGANLILLGYCGGKAPVISIDDRNETTFPGSAVCLHAYFVTYQGAKELVKKVKDWDYTTPIDWLTETFCQQQLCYLSTSLSNPQSNYFGHGIIYQDRNLGSNIDNKKSFSNYLTNIPQARMLV